MSGVRISHGEALPLVSEDIARAVERESRDEAGADRPAALRSGEFPFGYRFSDLQNDPLNLLQTDDRTPAKLRALGATMRDGDPRHPPGVKIPTIYTFFGQFVDHDITLEMASDRIRANLSGPDFTPIPPEVIKEEIKNTRSPNLDLDSVYSTASPRNGDRMLLGEVGDPVLLPDHVRKGDIDNDLPRSADGVALIGDPRNDENVILAQLHVAFLKAHNALVDRLADRVDNFDEARKLLIQHYQWIVLDDFLNRVADPEIVKKIRKKSEANAFTPPKEFVMPLEFSVAVYRFGHSKVREFYLRYNNKLPDPTLTELFAATKFSGRLIGKKKLPANWVIDWTNFVNTDHPDGLPRPIDTTLSPTLLALASHGVPIVGEQNLAVRNLLRGYLLRIPTGQAVANALHAEDPDINPLTREEMKSAITKADQFAVLDDAGFTERTPLWFYILAEANYYSSGYHLGPVGSTIVAEVLIGVLLNSEHSILREPDWRPSLEGKVPGEFELSDLLRLAGVL